MGNKLKPCPFIQMKPCPFCGYKEITTERCLNCGAEASEVDAWNSRPIEDAQAQCIVELKAEVQKYADMAADANLERLCAEARLARVKEFCKNEPDDNERLVFAEDIRDILSDTPKEGE